MAAISNRMPGVTIAYTVNGVTKMKRFSCAHKGKRFYTRQFAAGNNPRVVGEHTMAKKTTTTTKTAPKKTTAAKKAAPKKTAKSPAPKKTTPKTSKKAASAKAKASKSDRFDSKGRPVALRKPQVEILEVLNKNPKGLTRSEINEKLSTPCGLTAMIGTYDGRPNDKTNTLLERKYVKYEVVELQGDDAGKEATITVITAAGKKALAAHKKAAS